MGALAVEGSSAQSSMIEAVIFDIDGTIVDSNEFHVRAWDRAFRHFGKEFPLDELRQQIGKGADQYLPEFLNPGELRTIGKKIDQYRSELYRNEYLPLVPPFPRVRQLFERIKRDGKRIALASSGKDQELKVYRKVAEIDDLVDCAATSDDADESKPAPDIFEAALEKLGSPSPHKILAVGDTPYDAEAAKKVGVQTIGVLCGGFREAQLRQAGVIALYRDPADLLEQYDESPLVS
jgi:HAD superfamily hydrolase (TIGR01509 family)